MITIDIRRCTRGRGRRRARARARRRGRKRKREKTEQLKLGNSFPSNFNILTF